MATVTVPVIDEEYEERGDRKARIGMNAMVRFGANSYAVFTYSKYKGRWYYNGYKSFETETEARSFKERFLGGAVNLLLEE